MQGHPSVARQAARVAVLGVVLLLSGCSIFFPDTVLTEPPPVAVPEPEVAETAPAPVAVRPKPAPRKAAPAQLPPVAIVVAGSQPAYAEVAEELARQLDDYEVYDLDDGGPPPVTVLRNINDSKSSAVVAIGLRAARSAVAMAESPVIFSQVFNHQDYDLLTENSRGVAATVPVDAQIKAWKEIDPTISRIGAIVGGGHEDLLAEAEIAAQKHGVEIQLQVARSDQETLYFFRRMVRDIDGFLLIPDNRILSPRILQQMLEDARRHDVMVAVSNDAMLEMGAAISMSTVAADIATTIVGLIRRIQAGELDRIPPITPLSEIRVTTNDAVLENRVVASSEMQSAP
jgi:ABC-type uncharacterized transport system substrate-binding protein